MNRVRAHRRYKPNLQPLTLQRGSATVRVRACTRCRRTQRKAS
jgi:ribosomal protein L28